MMKISAIVEGQGDAPSVRILADRLLNSHTRWDVRMGRIQNTGGKSTLLKRFEDFVQYARFDKDCCAILVVVDADHDCPVDLAKSLSARAAALGLQVPIATVVPHYEFEAWFIAALDESPDNPVRVKLQLTSGVRGPDDPDATRNPKGWLQRNMERSSSYTEPTDQPALAAVVDLEMIARRSRSFRRMEHALIELLDAVDGGAPIVTPRAVP